MTHITLMLALFAVLTAAAAQAQVRLDNTIKKVQTFVNESGEVQRRMVDADSVIPGDELQYTVRFTNHGEQTVDAGTIVITDAIPTHTEYLDGTAFGSGTQISFSVDGEVFAAPAQLLVLNEGDEDIASAQQYTGIRWAFSPMLAPGESSYVSFNVRLK